MISSNPNQNGPADEGPIEVDRGAQPPAPPPVYAPPTTPGELPPPPSTTSVAVFVLGIVSIVTFCLCYGVISIPCAIVALVLARKAQADIAAGRAGPSAPGQVRVGRICATIGLVIALLYDAVVITMIVIIGATGGGGGGGGVP